jgi:uncharacterized protein YukE
MDLNQKEETTNPIKQERRGQHQQSVILWIVVVLAVVLSTLALALSIYASIAKTDSDSKLEETFDKFASTVNDMSSLLMQISSNTIEQHEERIADLEAYRIASIHSLQKLIERLNTSNYYNGTVENQLPQILELNEEVSGLIAALARSLVNLFSQFQQVNETISKITDTLHQLSVNILGQGSTIHNELDLTSGCVQVQSTCVINHNNIGTPPASGVCETDLQDVDVPGYRNVNIYCNVDNSAGETNPVTSTLNIYSGEVSCLCSLVALTAPTASPKCRLTIQRCPETIQLNTTNMR